MSNKKVYPSWRYHKTEAAKIIETAEEDAALGKNWADSPAAFEVARPEAQSATPSEDSADAELSKDEVYDALLAGGYSKKDLKGLNHFELLALPKEK